jgi:hypothetical protein
MLHELFFFGLFPDVPHAITVITGEVFLRRRMTL